MDIDGGLGSATINVGGYWDWEWVSMADYIVVDEQDEHRILGMGAWKSIGGWVWVVEMNYRMMCSWIWVEWHAEVMAAVSRR